MPNFIKILALLIFGTKLGLIKVPEVKIIKFYLHNQKKLLILLIFTKTEHWRRQLPIEKTKGVKNAAGDLEVAVSPPTGPGQSFGGSQGAKLPEDLGFYA